MFKLLKFFFFFVVACVCFGYYIISTDSYIRMNTLKLTSMDRAGVCSGEQINFNRHQYVLTAAHCLDLADPDGNIVAIDYSGKEQILKVVVESPFTDLLLLSPFKGLGGLDIANKSYIFDKIRVFGYPHNHQLAKSEGELLELVNGGFLKSIKEKKDVSDLKSFCNTDMPKFKLRETKLEVFGHIFELLLCVTEMPYQVHTAHTYPGNSGGPIVNVWGSLVGVVSAGDKDFAFNYSIPLEDILAFLNTYEKEISYLDR